MGDTVGAWLDLVEDLYPPSHAADWDEVGLHVGARSWEVERVLVSLDVTAAVVEEAADGPPTMLLAHHPLLFEGLDRVTPDTADGRVALSAATRHVAVAAAHTNLDVATDGAGTSQPVADLLGLTDTAPLTSEARDGVYKLVTFVPDEAVGTVIDALAAAGAGHIGDYERCSFRVRGHGTFRPTGGARPHTGEVGADNVEEEVRIEMEVPRAGAGAAVRSLLAAHPYDEVAYDLHPTVTDADVGFGLVGGLPDPLTLRALAATIRDDLPAPALRFAGEPERILRRVAVVGGAGDSLIPAALGAGADAYVTGDLRHHVTLDALEMGLALVDGGHHATEVAAVPAWRDRLAAAASARGLQAQVVASSVRTAPWRSLPG